ncbi:MAG TPA: hypothetical protein VNZ49_03945 [Bacteroidia bacterium]|jgi:antitoxin component YwqK of YwqJK toxin-antitoxin module|nr:hypothetical protein [Bacteroidia bacterium]
MKNLSLILGVLILLAIGAKAQVTLNEKGLYQDKDGALYTGVLETTENNQKCVIEVRDGYANGEAKYYYASGKLMEIGFFENGLKNGKWLRYNESGIAVGLALFTAGKKNGTCLVWDDKGRKLFEMHYANGEKTGTWFNWDDKGVLIGSKDFGNAN